MMPLDNNNSVSSNYKWLVLFNIMISTFMVVLDTTVVNTALPVIMGTLGASMNTAEWILTGYMLSMATVLAMSSWLSTRFGFKNIYIASLLIFTLGSFLCSISTSIEELIFWRIIEGIGGGLLMPVGLSIVTTTFSAEQRNMAIGLWSIATAASVSFGPMIGGYLVDSFSWNYIFYINIPIGLLCAIFAYVVQRKESRMNSSRLDWWGVVTSSIFLPVFLYGLSQVNASDNPQGWSSPIVVSCMLIAAFMFAVFIYAELHVKAPLIDLRIFRYRNFSIANFVILIFAIGMFGSTFLIPLYLQDSLGYSAFQSGLMFLPAGLIQAFASPLSSRLIEKIDGRAIIIVGLLLLSYSFVINSSFSVFTSHDDILHSLLLRSFALGILYPPLMAISVRDISFKDMPQASGLTNIIRQVGGSIGVAFFTYNMSIRRNYHSQVYSESLNYLGEEYNQSVDRLTQFYQSASGDNAIAAVQQSKSYIDNFISNQAYVSAINDQFIVGAIFTMLAVLPVLFISRNRGLRRRK